MSVNVTVYDLDNYPDNGKTVTIDIKSVIPTGYGGDEKWVVSADTTTTASGSATIQESFAHGTACGWSKSSSKVSSPFTVTSSDNQLKVAIDEDLSSGITIGIVVSASAQTGDSLATDIESKIRAATVTGGAKPGNLSYLNARCIFRNGRFIISSGSISTAFSGAGRSSVRVGAAASFDASAILGFDTPIESEEIAVSGAAETYVTAIVSSSTTVPCSSVTNIVAGDCVAFKNTDGVLFYRYVDSVSAPNIVVNTAVSLAENAHLQVMRLQDPEVTPPSYYLDVDSVVRHSLEAIARQINYAS